MDERRLEQELAALPRRIPPRQDLWPDIRCQLADRPTGDAPAGLGPMPGVSPGQRLGWLSTMAAGVLLAVSMVLWQGAEQAGGPILVDSGMVAPAGVPASGHLLASVTPEYRAALAEFEQLGGVGASPLAALRQVEMAAIAVQLERLRAAVSAEPDNLFLAERLMQLESSRLRMLQQLALADARIGDQYEV